MNSFTPSTRSAGLVMLLVVAGCSGPSYDVAEVSGTVTLNGEALAGANVSFQPSSQDAGQIAPGPGSYATTDGEGRFTLRLVQPDRPGAVVGRHSVRITTARETDPASDAGEMTEEVLPESYRDGSLQFDVPPEGTTQADFAIQSDR